MLGETAVDTPVEVNEQVFVTDDSVFASPGVMDSVLVAVVVLAPTIRVVEEFVRPGLVVEEVKVVSLQLVL